MKKPSDAALKFCDALRFWKIPPDSIERITDLEDIALKLSLVGHTMGRQMIVDYTDHLHYCAFSAAYVNKPALLISLFENVQGDDGHYLTRFVKCAPEYMEIHADNDPRYNFLYLRNRFCPAAANSELWMPGISKASYNGEEMMEEEKAEIPVPAEEDCSYMITTVTFPTGMLIHPKGSVASKKAIKTLLVEDLDKLGLEKVKQEIIPHLKSRCF